MSNPNLGTYSPTTVHVAATAKEALTTMADSDFDLRRHALTQVPLATPLVKAQSRVTGTIRLRFGVAVNQGCRWADLVDAQRMGFGDTDGWWPGPGSDSR